MARRPRCRVPRATAATSKKVITLRSCASRMRSLWDVTSLAADTRERSESMEVST